jgi:DNA-binding transcriptional regulator YdaS (Cro superfamily)
MSISDLLRRVEMKSYCHLHTVLAGSASCSPQLAVKIEHATSGAITRSMLRPDLWPPEPEKENTTSRDGATV